MSQRTDCLRKVLLQELDSKPVREGFLRRALKRAKELPDDDFECTPLKGEMRLAGMLLAACNAHNDGGLFLRVKNTTSDPQVVTATRVRNSTRKQAECENYRLAA